MSSFVIEGGQQLSGTIEVQGAKNEALQVISACLLTPYDVEIDNIPNISDVNNLISLLRSMGVVVTQKTPQCYVFNASNINEAYLTTEDFFQKIQKLRGSILTAGPLLARFGKIQFPQPGGDKIGQRRLDSHFTGFIKLGAKVEYDNETTSFRISAKNGLKGTYILLDEASVTGTANIITAATLAEGETTIFNAACEPYIVQLCTLLKNMGANIKGIGSNLLTIQGCTSLKGAKHKILPDMIEVGSFIGMAAMTKSELLIKNVGYKHLGLIPDVFRNLGIKLQLINDDDILVPAQEHYQINEYLDGSMLTIADAPWPGFTPDLISIALVTAIQAKGCLLIHQKMFESRLFFVDKLVEMGAKIILCDPHRVTIFGLNHERPLRGVTMTSPDIRAGVALLIAALSAKGKSIIENIEQIDRGYQNIENRLRNIGANIIRI